MLKVENLCKSFRTEDVETYSYSGNRSRDQQFLQW